MGQFTSPHGQSIEWIMYNTYAVYMNGLKNKIEWSSSHSKNLGRGSFRLACNKRFFNRENRTAARKHFSESKNHHA